MTTKSRKKLSERDRFERWARRFWGGLPLTRNNYHPEYDDGSVQVGWEAWQRSARIKR